MSPIPLSPSQHFGKDSRQPAAGLECPAKGCSPLCPLLQPKAAGAAALTHRDILEADAGDVVVGAALPGVVEAEGQGAGVPPLQRRELAEGAVLHVDGAVVELDPSDGKVPAGPEETERLGHGTRESV